MALRVNSNIAALNALRQLNRTEQALTTNLERLSSGRRLNRAADGPASLVISEQMKAQIESLGQAIRNSETSVSMVQTTESALSEVSSILINLRQLAVHAANEGGNDEKMLEADQIEVENLLSTVRNIARNTQFGTQTLLDGSNASDGVAVGDGLNFISATETSKSSPAEGYKVNITQVATRSFLVGTRALRLEDVVSSDPSKVVSFVINEGGRTVGVDLGKNKELNSQIEKIASAATRDGSLEAIANAERAVQQLIASEMQRQHDEAVMELDVFVYRPAEQLGAFLSSFDTLNDALSKIAEYPGEVRDLVGDEEVIVIRHREFGSDPNFTVSTTLDDFFKDDTPANEATFSVPGRDVEGSIGGNPEFGSGEPAIGDGQFLTGAPGSVAEGVTVRYSNTTDDVIYEVFNRLDNRVAGLFRRENSNDLLVGEPVDGYVHVTQNALAFQIGPNQGHQSKISVRSINPEFLANNLENESGFRSLADIDVRGADLAQDALLVVDQAIEEVSSLRGRLGSFQKNALETNLNNLRVAQENLTASESQLADTDMAEEMSNLVKNQILLSSGTAMLAQANQVPRSVLQLLNVGQ